MVRYLSVKSNHKLIIDINSNTKPKNTMKTILTTLLLFLMIGCAETEMESQNQNDQTPTYDELVVVVHPTEGNDANGVVRFLNEEGGVQVVAEIHGLEANSNHGFHIHQYGDCTAPDGTSAGGHFNPQENPHAGPTDSQRHVGDLGNLESDDDGLAELNYLDTEISFEGINNILGRGVVVHAGEDDLETQPTGDAGARLGCGVIGVAQTE